MTEQQIVKKNERYTVEIVDLSYEGMGEQKSMVIHYLSKMHSLEKK
ncbi:23S rRNA (uracil-5-)-methyltransferase [Enterococcus sp. GMD1E]|nr:23S rRNA (uracil-5-)-methyltransferase [Enterococcus sp. GMD1E]